MSDCPCPCLLPGADQLQQHYEERTLQVAELEEQVAMLTSQLSELATYAMSDNYSAEYTSQQVGNVLLAKYAELDGFSWPLASCPCHAMN